MSPNIIDEAIALSHATECPIAHIVVALIDIWLPLT